MPELPEVETLKLALQKHVEGMVIERAEVRDPVLRLPVPEGLHELVAGCRVMSLNRRAKYLVFALEQKSLGKNSSSRNRLLLVHLGMTGFLQIVDTATPPLKYERVAFHLDSGASLRYTDPRKFGLIEVFQAGPGRAVPELLQGLGPEPLERGFTVAGLREALQGSSRPIKNLLLDQTAIAGIGNIYASEALFQARVHPERPADSLGANEVRALHAAIRRVLRQAIACGSTMVHRLPGVVEEQAPKKSRHPGDFGHVAIRGRPVFFELELNVYEREGELCRRCGVGVIQRLVQSGRSSYVCPACQLLNPALGQGNRK